MAKTGKQLYLASRTPAQFQETSSFYTKSPLTGMRTFFVWYHEDSLTSASFEPSALTADPGADSERIELNSAIRQILTKDYFADIQPLADVRATLPSDIKSTSEIPTGAPGFVIRTWFAGDQTAKVDGLYGLPSGEPLGYVVFYRKAETSSPPNWSRTLGIIHRVKSSSSFYKTQSWTHLNDNLGNWTTVHYRDLPGGDVKLSRNTRTVTSRTSANEFVQSNTTEEVALSATGALGALVLVSSDEEEFDDVGGLKRLVRRTSGSNLAGGRQRTSLYGWINTPSNSATHGRPQWEYHPDGSFAHHTYSYSTGATSGSIITRRPWRDTTWTPGATAPADTGCVVETTSFTATTMTVTRKLSGTDLISSEETTWGTDGSGYNVLTEKTRYGSNVGDVLTTTTGYHPSTAAAHLANRIAWRVQQDGSAEKYTYTSPDGSGNYTQTVDAGAGSATSVTQGRKSVSIRNIKGHVTSRTEKWFKTGTGATEITLSTWVVDNVPYGGGTLNAFDFLGRPQGKVHNSNTNDYEAIIHGCCGVAYERDRTGRITEYFQDEMHRLYKRVETTGAVVETTTTALAGEVGFAGMVTETRRSSGALDLLLGKRWITTNGELDKNQSPDQDGASGPETTIYAYSYPGAGRTVTVTRPDNSTSISSYYADRRKKSVSGTAFSDASYDYTTHTEQGGGIVTTHTRLTSTGGTGEWTKTYSDLAGRTFRVEYPTDIHASPALDHSTTTYFNHSASAGSRGKPASLVDPDGVTWNYTHDAEGSLWKFTEAMPGSVGDRVTETLHDAVSDGTLGGSLRTITKLNGVTVSTALQGGNGYGSSENSFGRVTTTIRTVASGGDWTETTTHPEGTRTVRAYEDGRLASLGNRDNTTSPGALVSSESYSYDALGRLTSTVDSRTGTTSYMKDGSGAIVAVGTSGAVAAYTEAGNLQGMRDPGARVTTFAYDSMGRRTSVDAPNTSFNNVTNTSYSTRGEVQAEWGDNTYPTFRTYDEQGRLLTLRTQPTLASGVPTDAGGSFTSWEFDSERGWLTAKEYPDGPDSDSARDPGPSYTHTAAGRVKTRTWARGVVTTYNYSAGQLVGTVYSESTAAIDYTYDTLGRLRTVTQGSGSANTHTYAYKDDSNGGGGTFGTGLGLHSETVVYGGPGLGRTLVRHQDSLLRPAGWELKDAGTALHATSYGYDVVGRLKHVDPAYPLPTTPAYTYAYEANSAALVATVTGPVHTVTNTWESTRDALDTKKNADTAGTPSVPSSFNYSVNNLGQRDLVGPMMDGGSPAAPISIHSVAWEWAYNDRGELESADHGDDGTANTKDRFYAFDAIGNRDYVREGGFTDSSGTQVQYTANALNQYTVANGVTLPTPAFDADGNNTNGPIPVATGNATLEWDAENRLVKVTRADSVVITYAYDYHGRRISKTVGGGTARHYFYEGWNPVAEYAGHTLDKTYLWGMDLSGSIQGAGGVGGLLAVKEGAYHYYPTFDGNGNVGEYLDAAGVSAAHYEYDAFGNTVASSGTKQSDFAHRFSTKFFDSESGFYYYGYRYYDPVTGRWPSRDPIGERGGVNLYGFLKNNGISGIDILGYEPMPDFQPELNPGDFKTDPFQRPEIDGEIDRDEFNGNPGDGVDPLDPAPAPAPAPPILPPGSYYEAPASALGIAVLDLKCVCKCIFLKTSGCPKLSSLRPWFFVGAYAIGRSVDPQKALDNAWEEVMEKWEEKIPKCYKIKDLPDINIGGPFLIPGLLPKA